MNLSWTVRVGLARDQSANVRTRMHSFLIGQSVDFGATAPGASAVELLLGSLGADILIRFADLCERRRIPLDQVEARVEGRLDNALFALGVIGEEGDPALTEASVSLSVVSPATEDALRSVWQEVLLRSPLVNTLRKCATLTLEIQLL